jgi:hypothetical protein
MVLWELFHTFFYMGFFSFGGGYAMTPFIEAAVTKYGWMSSEQLTNIIAIAGMSPRASAGQARVQPRGFRPRTHAIRQPPGSPGSARICRSVPRWKTQAGESG